MAVVKLTAPNGATVSVDKSRAENLLRRGFTEQETKKAPAKKAASPKKSDD